VNKKIISLSNFVSRARENTVKNYTVAASYALKQASKKCKRAIYAELTRAFANKSRYSDDIIENLARSEIKSITSHITALRFILFHHYTDEDVRAIIKDWEERSVRD